METITLKAPPWFISGSRISLFDGSLFSINEKRQIVIPFIQDNVTKLLSQGWSIVQD